MATPAGTRTTIPQGVVARVAAGFRYLMTGKAPEGWFGPSDPPPPMAPPETAGRQFDYPSGYNIGSQPRQGEPVTFQHLRALADNYDLMRLVIETRKDQLSKVHWAIRPRSGRKLAADDARCAELTDFLAYPDQEHSWDAWLRMLVEDMLVIDAATLYVRRTRGGKVYGLEPVDGATIRRVLDDHGRTPASPAPAYQQVLKGLPAVDYTRDQLLYLPRNLRSSRVYGMSPVEQVVMTVNIALRRQVHQLEYYTEGTTPDAIAGVPDGWTPQQIAQFQDYWDAMLADNTAERRHVRFVPGAVAKNFVVTKGGPLKDDYDEWLARIVCYAFSVSNQPFVKQMSRATSETAQQQSEEEGLAPLKKWTKSLIDRVLRQCFGYDDLEFVWRTEEDVDPLTQTQIMDTKLRSGAMTINEVRAADGLDGFESGNVPLVYTTGGAVRLADLVSAPPPSGMVKRTPAPAINRPSKSNCHGL